MSLKDGSIITLILFYLFKGRTILFLRGGGVGQIRKTNSCTTFVEEIKIAHGGTKQKNCCKLVKWNSYKAFGHEKKIHAEKNPSENKIMVHP